MPFANTTLDAVSVVLLQYECALVGRETVFVTVALFEVITRLFGGCVSLDWKSTRYKKSMTVYSPESRLEWSILVI